MISYKGDIQILINDTVRDTVYTNRVFVRVMHTNITESHTGLDTVWIIRVINRVMQHFIQIFPDHHTVYVTRVRNRAISNCSKNTILTFSSQDTVCYTVYSTRVTIHVTQKSQQQHKFKVLDNNSVCYTVCLTRVINRVIQIFAPLSCLLIKFATPKLY